MKASAAAVLFILVQVLTNIPDVGADNSPVLVYYGTKSVDRMYEEEDLYAPLLRMNKDRYYRPLFFLNNGVIADAYTKGIPSRKDLTEQIGAATGRKVVGLGKCFTNEDYILVDINAAPAPQPEPKKKGKGKPKKAKKEKQEEVVPTDVILKSSSYDIYDLGWAPEKVMAGDKEIARWQGYTRYDAGYYNTIVRQLMSLDKKIGESSRKPSYHFISAKKGVIGSYRIHPKSLEGGVYTETRFFYALDQNSVFLIPMSYRKARDSELIYMADFDGNGTDNFTILVKYWDNGTYFSQAALYEFRDNAWDLQYRSVPFGFHKQKGFVAE